MIAAPAAAVARGPRPGRPAPGRSGAGGPAAGDRRPAPVRRRGAAGRVARGPRPASAALDFGGRRSAPPGGRPERLRSARPRARPRSPPNPGFEPTRDRRPPRGRSTASQTRTCCRLAGRGGPRPALAIDPDRPRLGPGEPAARAARPPQARPSAPRSARRAGGRRSGPRSGPSPPDAPIRVRIESEPGPGRAGPAGRRPAGRGTARQLAAAGPRGPRACRPAARPDPAPVRAAGPGPALGRRPRAHRPRAGPGPELPDGRPAGLRRGPLRRLRPAGPLALGPRPGSTRRPAAAPRPARSAVEDPPWTGEAATDLPARPRLR